MNKKIHNYLLVVLLLVMSNLAVAQNVAGGDSLIKQEINAFIEEWHSNAADADIEYFDKIADNGNYIGTDATELWTKDEFVLWSKKYFDRGKAWTFITIDRNIYLADSGSFAWFDEMLETGMGKCRASGVLEQSKNGWQLLHYHLSITIPNESIDEIKEIIGNN